MATRFNSAMLLLGGNLGEVRYNFENACRTLAEYGDLKKKSRLYQTEAWGMEDAPDFLNQALLYHTTLTPEALLALSKDIEEMHGRRPAGTSGYQSRVLDIDILLYNDEQINRRDLQVPHPRMHLRNFTLAPAAEIEPERIHPTLGKSLKELYQNSEDTLKALPV